MMILRKEMVDKMKIVYAGKPIPYGQSPLETRRQRAHHDIGHTCGLSGVCRVGLLVSQHVERVQASRTVHPAGPLHLPLPPLHHPHTHTQTSEACTSNTRRVNTSCCREA
jgi:hypothetical protein